MQHIYYRRTRRLDVPLITDIQLLPESAAPPTSSGSYQWTKVSRSIRDGVYRADPLYLWYQTGKTQHEMTEEEKHGLITELDVLFGDGEPWYGFERLEPATTEARPKVRENVWLTYRRGVKRARSSFSHFPHLTVGVSQRCRRRLNCTSRTMDALK